MNETRVVSGAIWADSRDWSKLEIGAEEEVKDGPTETSDEFLFLLSFSLSVSAVTNY